MNQYNSNNRMRSIRRGRMPRLLLILSLFLFSLTFLEAQIPGITVRFTNPQFDCVTGEYCLDVEFQSDTPGEELFGMNVRLFYDDDILELIDFRDFQGGYGPVAPNPPLINTNSPAGPALFNFTGPAEFVNGAIQLVNISTTPIILPTTGWVKIFQMCFEVKEPVADPDVFCPSVVWDLQEDPTLGGFLTSDDGVMLTVVNPDPNEDSSPSNERVEQFNWAYDGVPDLPYGSPAPEDCISLSCVDIALDKSVDNATSAVGSQVVFTIDVTNEGPDDAVNVVVTDLLPSGFAYDSHNAGTYNPVTGEWQVPTLAALTGSASIEITATVLGTGDYVNLAEVTSMSGTDIDSSPGNGVDTDLDNNVEDDEDDEDDGDGVVVTLTSGSISLTKEDVSIDFGEDGILNEGDVINYIITVTNTGEGVISNLTVTDPDADGPISCLLTTLAVAQSTTCSATHTITQADLAAGSFTNQATADGVDPLGNQVTDISDDPDNPTDNDLNMDGEPDDPTVTILVQNADMDLEKTDTWNDDGDGVPEPGETITYAFKVTNTGNVTLTNINITDINVTVLGGPIPVLGPGAMDNTTFTAIHTLSQTDIDNGSYTNQAVATATPSIGSPITDDSDDPDTSAPNDPTVTDLPQTPELTVEKVDALDDDGDGLQAGDVINYTITVTNTGNVTLDDVTITDPDLQNIACVPAGGSSLEPGESMVCTGFYELTQADINNGSFSNTATASGTDPNDIPTIDDSDDPDTSAPNDPTTTELFQGPELQVIKVDAIDLGENNQLDVGDVINYTITIMNTGDAIIDNITINATNVDPGSIRCTPLEPITLAPGESAICTATYTLTQADINAGSVVNSARVTGEDPNDNPVDDDSDDPDDPTDIDPDQDGEPDDPTVSDLPCVTIKAWVYLEGAIILNNSTENYNISMRTDLNDLRLLPGQIYEDFFLRTRYNPAGQPYNIEPWNYDGLEGDAFDSDGDFNFADAGYPATVVDWVLVSLRDTPEGINGPICQAAALLHNDGRIEFVDEFSCCEVNPQQAYYLVIEHRNHLIVMSHEPINIVNGMITYDFRVAQSYIYDVFSFGSFSGQKEVSLGAFAMIGGNGDQKSADNSDTDINFNDRFFWESQNGDFARYRIGDYNLNGDTNYNDRRIWEINNGSFTSVPRE